MARNCDAFVAGLAPTTVLPCFPPAIRTTIVFLQLVPSAAIKRVASAFASSSMNSIGESTSFKSFSSPAGMRPPATFTPTFSKESTLVFEFAASVSTSGAVTAVIDPFLALAVGRVAAHLPENPSSLTLLTPIGHEHWIGVLRGSPRRRVLARLDEAETRDGRVVGQRLRKGNAGHEQPGLGVKICVPGLVVANRVDPVGGVPYRRHYSWAASLYTCGGRSPSASRPICLIPTGR